MNKTKCILETLDLVGVKEVTTKKQKKNGTRTFELPKADKYGIKKRYSIYDSGMIRNVSKGLFVCYQINRKRFVTSKNINGGAWKRILIPSEKARLEYLLLFILNNNFHLLNTTFGEK